MKEQIRSYIQAECPWRDTLHWLSVTDSTNLRARELAKGGAPEGTVVIAGGQTGGRGRLGRSFSSPQGQGVYLSVVLRPHCQPENLMHLTCAVGVAMCRAVERVSGIKSGLKWINDIVYDGWKLGGILTELSVDPVTGLVDHAIVGVGINCLQQQADFPEQIRDFAGSLAMASGALVIPEKLAAAMVEELWMLSSQLLSHKARWMAEYEDKCITLGQQIRLVRGDVIRYGQAVGLDGDGGLIVTFSDGHRETVNAGEVSVRGMYGYFS